MTDSKQAMYEALLRCNKCGFCLAGCPVYKATGIEWTVARGRLALLRGIYDNNLKVTELTEPLFNCLTCNGCVDHCPPGVLTDELILQARAEFMKEKGQPWIQKFLFRDVLQKPSLLNKSARALSWLQASGLPMVGRKLGVTKLMGNIGRAEPILPRIRYKKNIKNAAKKLENPRYKVAYFIGCAAANFTPQVAEAALRVLNRHNVEVSIPDFVCCGLPAYGYGDQDSMRSMMRKNLELARGLNVDAIIATCASCGSMLKKYAALLKDDAELAGEAKAFSGKVKDMSEFLVSIGLRTEMGTLKHVVTYHDPCHLGRFQKVSAQPRQIIRSIPGVEYREMVEANTCCGAAGSYNLTHYDISMKVLDRKMENVSRTSADLLVTCCPGCSMQLAYGIKSHKLGMKSLELVELLDRAYQSAEKKS